MAILPWGIQVSGITSFQSAAPFQPFLTGIDVNGNGVFSTAGESPYPDRLCPAAASTVRRQQGEEAI